MSGPSVASSTVDAAAAEQSWEVEAGPARGDAIPRPVARLILFSDLDWTLYDADDSANEALASFAGIYLNGHLQVQR